MFVPRLTRPEAGNKFYITKSAGGYSRAILGKPTDKECNVLANCVGYAFGRFHEIANRPEMDFFEPVNAELIYASAKKHGLTCGNTPKLGALIVWQKGTQSGSDGAGHVAVVEEIGTGGEITCSESGYGAKYPFWLGKYKPPYNYKSGYKLLGFVYQPDTPPDAPIKLWQKGDSVRWLQERLAGAGYMLAADIDGSYGRRTQGAVFSFQHFHALPLKTEVDETMINRLKG